MAGDGTRVGPALKETLQKAWQRGGLHLASLCWAEGWAHWRRLGDVRELRWAMARGAPVLTPAQVSRLVGGTQCKPTSTS